MQGIECPYCPADSSRFSDMDEVNVHILREHPEKTSLEENKADRKSRVWGAALELTGVSFAALPARNKEEVLERFKFFLTQLMGMGI